MKRIPAWLHICLPLVFVIAGNGVKADEVKIVDATVTCSGDSCRASVTLAHQDTGWDHYADYWRIVGPDGEELGRRVLLHPHVNEQPFTRSLGSFGIPAGVDEVIVEAHDSVHGVSSHRLTVPVVRN